MSGGPIDPIKLLSDSDHSSTDSSFDSTSSNFSTSIPFHTFAFKFALPLRVIMADQLKDECGHERTHLIDAAPDDLRWKHLDVKMVIASEEWRDLEIIKDLEKTYIIDEKIEGIYFKLAEEEE